MGGNDSGIFFVPFFDDDTEADEGEWVKVPDNFVTRNTPAVLEFFLPRTLETGKRYLIAVRTQKSGSNELKSAVIGRTKIAVTVEE